MKTSRVVSSSSLVATVITGLALGSFYEAQGAVAYSTAGSTYLQNFDTLPLAPENVNLGATSSGIGWTDDSASPGANQFSIVGWYLYHPFNQSAGEGGVNGHQRVRIGAGTVNTGAFMSFGTSGSTERALGDVGANTLNATAGPGGDIYIGLRLHNSTGATLDSFTLTYSGEQWRDGGAATPVAQTMTFGYSTTATAISDPNSSFTAVGGLSFTSPVTVNTGSGAAVNGNVAGKVTGITATVSGINWLDGTDLWLRWDDINDVGNDHGLAIDDLSFSAIAAVPEPATWALLGIGATAMGFYRRKRA